MPPFHFWPLVFVALVPLAIAFSQREIGRREAAEAGVLFGITFYGLVLHWVPFTLQGMIPLGGLSGALLLVLLGGVGGIQGVLLQKLLSLRSFLPVLVLPAVWVSTEFALARAGPWAFPWTPLGISLAPLPELAGMAEWVGPRGLTFWIAAVNGGVATLLVSWPGRRASLAAGLTALLVAGPIIWGFTRVSTLPVRSLPTVLLVQMAVPRDVLLDPERRDREATAALDRLLGEAARLFHDEVTPSLAVLPEAPFATPWNASRETWLRQHANTLPVPFLVGTHVLRATDPPSLASAGRSNALLLLDEGREADAVHEKVRLVPGVERPGLSPGRGVSVSSVGGMRVGMLICFESSFEADVRRIRREGADLLVNASNDGWFRPVPGMSASAAHAQQRAHLVMRAVETRTGAVRTSLGGEAFVVAPTGRVLVLGSAGEEGVYLARPTTSSVRTGFVRWGDLAGHAGALLLAALLFGRLPGRWPTSRAFRV